MVNDKELRDILQFISPGSQIRAGIDNVLRAKTGGLIVVGYNDKVKAIVDGGFYINCHFTPASLYELAKMDGAIILNDQGTKILYANAQLVPDPSILSTETGMRHRTAERTAKQTNKLVIAISQRRNVITVYKNEFRYALREMGVILTKANQALQTLDKYKLVLDQSFVTLGALEFENLVTYTEVLQVLHRIEMVLRIKNEIEGYVNELGTEGRLICLQMDELLHDVEKEAALLIKDYCSSDDIDVMTQMAQLQELSNNDLLNDNILMRLLGYPIHTDVEDSIFPRGYRVLHKIPRLPTIIIENLVQSFKNLKHIVDASVNELDEVEGIGEIRARKIQEGLKRIHQQLSIDRRL
ncbi:DNA integrity scanning protein DisA [Bacillus sp. HMF5848]|nr:DNA integrity scanning protein DisA [Bacillus sp. HMF5848]